MKTRGLTIKIRTKKPKNVGNCESSASVCRRRHIAPRELALDHLRHHADQSGASGNGSSRCRPANTRLNCEVEPPPLYPHCARMRRSSRIPRRSLVKMSEAPHPLELRHTGE